MAKHNPRRMPWQTDALLAIISATVACYPSLSPRPLRAQTRRARVGIHLLLLLLALYYLSLQTLLPLLPSSVALVARQNRQEVRSQAGARQTGEGSLQTLHHRQIHQAAALQSVRPEEGNRRPAQAGQSCAQPRAPAWRLHMIQINR